MRGESIQQKNPELIQFRIFLLLQKKKYFSTRESAAVEDATARADCHQCCSSARTTRAGEPCGYSVIPQKSMRRREFSAPSVAPKFGEPSAFTQLNEQNCPSTA